MEYVEQSGFGINKITEVYGKNVFKITDNFITVVLPFNVNVLNATAKTTTKTTTKKSTEIENKILDIIKNEPTVTVKTLSLKLGVTEDGIRYHIKKLKKQGLLQYVGSSKSGHWEIKN